MRKPITLLAVVAMLTLMLAPTASAGAGGGPPPDYFVDESKLPFDPLPGATAYWGVHNNAGYRVEVPDNWNGDLVMWAHGFRGTGLELRVDTHPLREVLIPAGYAWAASSYSRNDYDITSGVQDTHALAKRFNGLVDKPNRVYITGASMGGHIAAVSIEQYPTYDGAMAFCGVLGDYELFDYFLDFNVAAQQLGLGTSTFPVDPLQYLLSDVPTIKANLEIIPGAWPGDFFGNGLNANGLALRQLTELRSGGDRPNFGEAWSFWNSVPNFASGPGNFLFDLGIGDGTLPRTPGIALDNTDVVYQFDTDPALSPEEQAFNDSVVRVAPDPQGRQRSGLAQVPAISGDIDVPMITLHNLGDLFVPFHNEIEYAKDVAAHGKSDLLVQRAIRGVGHCNFTGVELTQAFFELAAWVELGVKPAGDNVLDPEVVADPAYGCAFTDQTTPPFPIAQNGYILATPCP